MVAATMASISGSAATTSTSTTTTTHHHIFHHEKKTPSPTVGILAFETARAMSRLVSLYNSLTDDELYKLKEEILKSHGVTYLNSKDESFLLGLACAERLEDLNRIALTVIRLSQKCSNIGLNRFDLVYADLKLGIIDIRKLEFGTRSIEKIVEKMEKLTSTTSNLYEALEALNELEVQEKKIRQWKKITKPGQWEKINLDMFNEKIAYQRKQVRTFKQFSLWNHTFDKSVGLMARIVCIVYARICTVFEPYISIETHISKPRCSPLRIRLHLDHSFCIQQSSRFCPIFKTSNIFGISRFRRRKTNAILPEEKSSDQKGNTNNVFKLAPPWTVGGSGVAIRYGNIIILADRYFKTPEMICEDTRKTLFDMLPDKMKKKVKSEMMRQSGDMETAEEWREAVESTLEWLTPMAYDTLRWQAERNMERQKFDFRPTALLSHTLHYSDLEKTEAAIVEVLVGLTCVYRFHSDGKC